MERELQPEKQPKEQKLEYRPVEPIVIQTQEQLEAKPQASAPPDPPKPPGPGKGPLADIVYIYVSPDKPGIWFYDRTPKGAEAAFAGTYPDGKYVTDAKSIFPATWDDEVNVPNEAIRQKFYGGGRKVTTHMVSPEQMQEIVEGIEKAENPGRIIIDTRDLKLQITDAVSKKYYEFLEERQKIDETVPKKEAKNETNFFKPNQMSENSTIETNKDTQIYLNNNENINDIGDIPPVNNFKK